MEGAMTCLGDTPRPTVLEFANASLLITNWALPAVVIDLALPDLGVLH